MAATVKKATTVAEVSANFTVEKATKNTIRFTEALESEYSAPAIGTIYVPKATLGQIGYSEGKTLVVTVTCK